MIRAASIAASLIAGYAGPTWADAIVRLDKPAEVALALQDAGYRAKLTKDDTNRPVIETGVGGLFFTIKFFGCTESRPCDGVLFSAAFNVENGIHLDRLNAWNSDALIGRAYADEVCDPVIDHYILADANRASVHFMHEVEQWGDTLAEFRDFVFDDDAQSAGVVQCGGDDIL